MRKKNISCLYKHQTGSALHMMVAYAQVLGEDLFQPIPHPSTFSVDLDNLGLVLKQKVLGCHSLPWYTSSTLSSPQGKLLEADISHHHVAMPVCDKEKILVIASLGCKLL